MADDLVQTDERRVPTTPVEWADKVVTAWNKSVASILETARLVKQADASLQARPNEYNIYKKELEKRGLSDSTRSKLRGIADSENFKREHYACLPASYNYLYELADLKPNQYEKVYSKLSQGIDYKEATVVLRQKSRKKSQRQKLLFTFSADIEKLSSADKQAIERFVDGYARRNIISIRRSPSYKKLFAEDVE